MHVIDTKWKRIASRFDDPKQGVSQADVYQMMAYGQLYSGERLTLIYPHHRGLAGGEGLQARHRIGDGSSRLETLTFDVGDGENVAPRIRVLLIQHKAESSMIAEQRVRSLG